MKSEEQKGMKRNGTWPPVKYSEPPGMAGDSSGLKGFHWLEKLLETVTKQIFFLI